MGRDITTANFFTNCELPNSHSSKNMTAVGKTWKNKPAIPALFLGGKHRCLHSSIFCFTNELTLVSYVPARNKTLILLLSLHLDDTCIRKDKDHKPEIIMHYNINKSEFDVLDKLVKEHTYKISIRRCPLKLFLKMIDVACVNAFVLWMLKYTNW